MVIRTDLGPAQAPFQIETTYQLGLGYATRPVWRSIAIV